MKVILYFIVVLGITACSQSPVRKKYPGATEGASLAVFFNKTFETFVARSPETMAYLGKNIRQDQWDDRSEAFALETIEVNKKALGELRDFDRDALNSEDQLSYDLMERQLAESIDNHQWYYYHYPVNQMYGIQSQIPSLLMNLHRAQERKDLDNYISRLNGVQKVIELTLLRLKKSETKGVVTPKFVFDKVLSDSRNVITGRPFTKTNVDSPLLNDFKNKLKKIKGVSAPDQKTLVLSAEKALKDSVGPGYKLLISFLKDQKKRSTTDHGVWKFPKGEDYYKHRLARMTTTNYSADFIHRLGLINVDRIHGEMRLIMKKVKYKGNLQSFFHYMKTDKKFYFPQNKKGRAQYLNLAKRYIGDLKKKLGQLFITLPKAKLEVQAVESYREKSAGTAFYEGGTPDGSRPGRYYANLSNLKAMPTWEAESLAYHEAIPGHHMQISIAQEMKSLPLFRRYSDFTAYIEGWALYSEKAPKDIGQYSDPYSDFGRLSNELFRACRLVVDTGIHVKKWSREKAVAYLDKNTPSDRKENFRQIERYIVMPGQATAYMVGMLKILELRRRAKKSLGSKFDIRKFHEVILKGGAVPLDFLERVVKASVESQGGVLEP